MTRTPGTVAAAAMLIAGTILMIEGQRLWSWAKNEPLGEELLLIAAATGDTAGVRTALEQGATVEARSASDSTALALAATANSVEAVSLLLSRGADANGICYGKNSVLAVATYGDCPADILRLLLDAGADPNGELGGATPPLVCAAALGNANTVDLLLAAGADPNCCGQGKNRASPLTAAAASSVENEHLVKRLIEYGADVNQSDRDGLTPLQVASTARRTSVVSLLKRAGAVR